MEKAHCTCSTTCCSDCRGSRLLWGLAEPLVPVKLPADEGWVSQCWSFSYCRMQQSCSLLWQFWKRHFCVHFVGVHLEEYLFYLVRFVQNREGVSIPKSRAHRSESKTMLMSVQFSFLTVKIWGMDREPASKRKRRKKKYKNFRDEYSS